ncbi:TPA: IS5-like element ISAba10 family transposase, partial [Escherichia coli]|nr:IS5-like element ISAba10 family transposase [Escherichia coli]
KSRYKTTNWSEYNQALRQRGAFTIWFDPQMQWSATPTGKKGRQPTYTDIAIQFALTIRNLFQLALRQTQGFIQSFLQMAHLDWNVPDFSTLSRRADKLQPLLHKSAKNPQEDLHILVDSTGIKVTGDGEWVRKKHGVNQHRQWLKLHLATDANSGEIQAVEVTTCQYGDAEMLQPLLDQIDEPIASVTADGAYDTVNCYDA